MSEMTNRAIVESYARAAERNDFAEADQFLADDVLEEYPQSGERIRGKANRRAVIENYPGRESASASGDAGMGLRLLQITGSGDDYTAVGIVTYPNGERWHMVSLVGLRGGKIAKITSFFAAPFEAPAWRAPYLEKVPAAGRA
jgi:hypothetical protein